MANAMLTVLHKLGVDDIESFGDSTGELPLTALSLVVRCLSGLVILKSLGITGPKKTRLRCAKVP
jgi:hypothetical protein